MEGGEQQRRILESFHAEGFIATSNENYEAIEQTAREIGILEP